MAGKNNLDISVRSTIRSATLQLEARARGAVDASTVRALNRTATTVRAQASRKIRERYNLKAGVIKAQMKVLKATRSRLVAQIVAAGRRIPLIEFSARQTGKGVTARVTRARRLYRGAFITTMRSGHTGVFLRLGPERLPIKQLVGISIPKAMAERRIHAALAKLAAERFAIEFVRDLRFRLG